MRWVFWILTATATFVVAALLFPRTTPHLSGSPAPPSTAPASPGAEMSGRARVIDGDSILVSGSPAPPSTAPASPGADLSGRARVIDGDSILVSGSPAPPSTAPASPGADLSGRARVIDGDSILVDQVEVRLYGLDAPEAQQTCVLNGVRWPCGRQATRALQSLIEGRVVVCDERDRDNYGRVVAVCQHDGANVNAWLVANGWAMAYRRHALAYLDAESTAKSAKRGIWRGDFVAPWDWRQAGAAGVRATASPSRTADTRSQRSASAPGRCNIKGNISHNSGRRLYHMPGDRDYADTRISAARGERWFCSEAEARTAGWQPAVRSRR